MNCNLRRTLAILGVVLFFSIVSAACQEGSPARPSSVTPSSSGVTQTILNLTGLSGSYVGMANELCDGGAAVAIDDLRVEYQVSGRSLAGALLVACGTDDCQGSKPLGTITECPLPPNPCEAGLSQAVSEGQACLVGDPEGTGSVRVYAARAADAPASWSVMVYFNDDGNRTNTVSATVDETQEVTSTTEPSMDSVRFARRIARLPR